MEKPFILRRPFPYTYKRCVLWIILINLVCYFSLYFAPELRSRMALSPAGIIYFKMYWQFLTYAFMHYDFSHVFFNMLGLFFFGMNVEKGIGSIEFVIFYLYSCILSGALSFGYYCLMGQNVFMIGASGALFAVMFAYAVLFPRSVIYIWGIIPVPAPLLVLIYSVIELFSGFIAASSNVAHFAHLFGFFAAWLYFVVRMGIHPIKLWKNTYKK